MLSTRFATPRAADVLWLDEELPADIYGEALTRTNA
jgi:phage terminase large subunit-like protein